MNREDAAMKTTLTIDDDVAVLLERQARAENRPFDRVVNEALRRGTSRLTVADARRIADPDILGSKAETISGGDSGHDSRRFSHGLPEFKVESHKGQWMAGDNPARLKEILDQTDTEHDIEKMSYE